MNKGYFHGECVIKKCSFSDFKNLIPIKAKNGFYIIANSETTGNHHIVIEKDGVELYEHEGTLYVKNDVEAEVKCVDEKRHDTITLEPGVWEIDRANEYDYLKEETRKVSD